MPNVAMFHALDSEGGDKVDFWILKPDHFNQSKFQRRYKENAAGTEMFISVRRHHSRQTHAAEAKSSWQTAAGGIYLIDRQYIEVGNETGSPIDKPTAGPSHWARSP
jgi:hypothetical protein